MKNNRVLPGWFTVFGHHFMIDRSEIDHAVNGEETFLPHSVTRINEVEWTVNREYCQFDNDITDWTARVGERHFTIWND
jgi:hypothetical protein